MKYPLLTSRLGRRVPSCPLLESLFFNMFSFCWCYFLHASGGWRPRKSESGNEIGRFRSSPASTLFQRLIKVRVEKSEFGRCVSPCSRWWRKVADMWHSLKALHIHSVAPYSCIPESTSIPLFGRSLFSNLLLVEFFPGGSTRFKATISASRGERSNLNQMLIKFVCFKNAMFFPGERGRYVFGVQG